MSIELKIKAASLELEAKYIRKYERKFLAYARKADDPFALRKYNSLRNHRIGTVRHAARLTHLARGYIKGLRYKQLEAKTKQGKELTASNIKAIAQMANRYGPNYISAEKISEWVNK